jgi:hypothetical protein
MSGASTTRSSPGSEDQIALEAARKIDALPNAMYPGQKKASVQVIVLEAMRAVAQTVGQREVTVCARCGGGGWLEAIRCPNCRGVGWMIDEPRGCPTPGACSCPPSAQRSPMAADIEQILSQGYANGKTRAEIAEEIRREFDAPAQSAMLPRKLTAENGAKAALICEFHEEFTFMDEEGYECTAKVPVTWDTIKRIWDSAVAHFDRTSQVTSTNGGGAAK